MALSLSFTTMGLSAGAQERLAVLLADLLGEPMDIAREVAAFLDAYLRRVPFQAAVALRVVIWAIAWLPLFFIARLGPAHVLPPGLRARYLAAWSQSHIYLVREGFFLFKAIALMGWGSIERVRERLGVEPLRAGALRVGAP
jgi:hypothetical protein